MTTDTATTTEPNPASDKTPDLAADHTEHPPATGDSGAATRFWSSGRWMVVALAVGYLLHVAWRIWLVRDLIAPAAHADEDGYLVAARAIAGGPGGFSTENTAFRRTGYPLILSPIYWFTSEAFQVYRATQVVNAAINALMFPLSFLFARRVLGMSRRWSLPAAFTAAAMPAIVFYSGLAMADAILAVIGISWLLLVHTWVAGASTRTRWLGAVGAGAMVGLAYLVHVRGTMLVLAHGALVLALFLLRRVRQGQDGPGRVKLPMLVVSVLAVAPVAAVDFLIKHLLGDAITLVGRSPKSHTLDSVTTVVGIARTIAGAVGQGWYLSAGTWGVGAIGLVAAVLPLLRRAELRQRLADRAELGRLVTITLALAATCLIAAGSAASLPPSDHRINYFAYPRYIHFLFPVWFLVGLAALWNAGPKLRIRLAAGVGGGMLVLGALLKLRTSRAHGFRFMAFDAPETSFLSWHWDGIQITVPTVAAVALLLVIIAAQVNRRTRLAAVAGILALNVVAGYAIVDHVTRPMVVPQYTADTPRLVRDLKLGRGDVVAAVWETPFPTVYNHMREVDWRRLEVFSERDAPPANATVVIGPWRTRKPADVWDGTRYGFTRIAIDRTHEWAVWRRT